VIVFVFECAGSATHVPSARETIWINPGFQEQLVLFQVCQYNPHPGDGVYASWKTKVDRKLRAAGLR
jgi:dual specificity phosphatase 12